MALIGVPKPRNKYNWLDYQVQAKSVSQYLDALRNPDVDNVVMVGEDASTMPTFAYADGQWSIDTRGVTNKQKQLARMIKAQGLEAEYIAKSPVERTTANSDYVANRDAGSRAMWEAKAEEESAGKNVQYSVDSFNDVLSEEDFARFYAAVGEMKIGKKDQFSRTKSGQFMVAIDNKIVYTDGRWKNPSIDRVDTILLADETEVDFVRQTIFQNEGGEISNEQARDTIRGAFGDEVVWRRDGGFGGTFVWENERGEGANIGADYSEDESGTRQYSVQFDADERLNALRNFAKDLNLPELYKYTLGEKLNAIFRGIDLKPSFDQVNPVRIIKNLAAELGTGTYTNR